MSGCTPPTDEEMQQMREMHRLRKEARENEIKDFLDTDLNGKLFKLFLTMRNIEHRLQLGKK